MTPTFQDLRQRQEHELKGSLDMGSDSWLLPLINDVNLGKVPNLFFLPLEIMMLLSSLLDSILSCEDEMK